MNASDPAHDAPRPEPIPPGTPQPLWSVMIPTFNCAHLLRKTLGSVLAQDPGPDQMHIEVVDDCSTKDDPEAVVREVGKGRVAFYRRERNGGVTTNFNTCVMRSRGQLVHLLHGDDFVYPGFYRRIGELAAAHPDIAGYFVRCFEVDEAGEINTLLWRAKWLETSSRDPADLPYLNIFQPPGVVIRRAFYEQHGGYLPAIPHTGDWEMFLRVIMEGGAASLNEPLAGYRVSAGNDSSRLARTGGNIRDILRLGEIMRDRLPSFDAERFRRWTSNAAWSQIQRARARHDREAVEANLKIWREITPWPRRVRQQLMARIRQSVSPADHPTQSQ